jgi:hypothetical protein
MPARVPALYIADRAVAPSAPSGADEIDATGDALHTTVQLTMRCGLNRRPCLQQAAAPSRADPFSAHRMTKRTLPSRRSGPLWASVRSPAGSAPIRTLAALP